MNIIINVQTNPQLEIFPSNKLISKSNLKERPIQKKELVDNVGTVGDNVQTDGESLVIYNKITGKSKYT